MDQGWTTDADGWMVVGWLLARRYFCGRQSSLAVKLPAEREGGVSERV